jgi:hypothetical protein
VVVRGGEQHREEAERGEQRGEEVPVSVVQGCGEEAAWEEREAEREGLEQAQIREAEYSTIPGI